MKNCLGITTASLIDSKTVELKWSPNCFSDSFADFQRYTTLTKNKLERRADYSWLSELVSFFSEALSFHQGIKIEVGRKFRDESKSKQYIIMLGTPSHPENNFQKDKQLIQTHIKSLWLRPVLINTLRILSSFQLELEKGFRV